MIVDSSLNVAVFYFLPGEDFLGFFRFFSQKTIVWGLYDFICGCEIVIVSWKYLGGRAMSGLMAAPAGSLCPLGASERSQRTQPANAASERTMFPRFTLSKVIFVMFFIISFLTSFSLKKSRGPHPSNPRPQGPEPWCFDHLAKMAPV